MAGKKSPGMISLVLLVGLGLLGTVWAGLLGVTRQALKDWQLKQEARQDAVLFRSLCGIREGEPFLAPGEKRQLEPVRFQPEGPLVYASLETIQEGRIREEVLRLHRETGEELMKGRRYEIRMPGTEPGEIFPETGIWAEGRKEGKLFVDWSLFGRKPAWSLPDSRRMEAPVDKVFCYGRETLQWPEKTGRTVLLQGSGVLVNRGSIRFRQGFRCKGDFRFLANGDITVEKGARLENAYLYATGTLTLEPGSHVTGILACRGPIVVKKGAEFVKSERVVGAFRTKAIA